MSFGKSKPPAFVAADANLSEVVYTAGGRFNSVAGIGGGFMHRISFTLLLAVGSALVSSAAGWEPAPAGRPVYTVQQRSERADQVVKPRMLWGDTSRLGRPFAKDPSVIRFRGRYLLYYSMPAFGDGRENDGWGIGIAESRNLYEWTKLGEFLAGQPAEGKGVAAPFAMVLDGRVHLFYQSYGHGPADAICHAVSSDGVSFEHDPTNPIFRPTGAWTVGRAIDAEVVRHRNRWLLFVATRDPQMKVQMIAGAYSESGFERGAWKMLADRPLLKPELPWEQDCIEAPSVIQRGETMFMFYGGAYNNAPQQVGLARSTDGITWTRVSNEPFLPNGAPGAWNASESGHPGVFVDDTGTPYLFYQGNADQGRTWTLSVLRLGWRDGQPVIANRRSTGSLIPLFLRGEP